MQTSRVAGLFLMLPLSGLFCQTPGSRILFSFEQEQEISTIKAVNVRLERVAAPAGGGKYSLAVNIQPGERPGITLSSGAQPWDWRPFGALAFNIANSDESPVELTIEVKDAAGALTKGSFRLQGSGETPVALLLNSPSPLDMGMRGPAAIPHFRLASSDYRKIDLSRVRSIAIGFSKTTTPQRVTLGAVRLIAGNTYDKIVDPLGQFALGDWPGKMRDASEFASRRAAEEAAIAAHPVLPRSEEHTSELQS